MDLAGIVIVMEPVHIRNSTARCRSQSRLASHHLDTCWTILRATLSHRTSVSRLPRVISHHPRHFPRTELSPLPKEQVGASGVAMEATRAGFGVALSSLGGAKSGRPGECVTFP